MSNTEKKNSSPGSSTFAGGTEHEEKNSDNVGGYVADTEVVPRSKLNALFENPLAGISREQLFKDVDDFCSKFNLMDHNEAFRKGALVAQNPHAAQDMDYLNDQDKAVLLREHTHKWDQPKTLYYLVSEYSCFDYHSYPTKITPIKPNVLHWPAQLASTRFGSDDLGTTDLG